MSEYKHSTSRPLLRSAVESFAFRVWWSEGEDEGSLLEYMLRDKIYSS